MPKRKLEEVSNVEESTKKKTKKKDKLMDWSKYSIRHIALKIAYLGWSYHGLSIQREAEHTVEGAIYDALKRVKLVDEKADWRSMNFARSGRTDKGVSAFMNVVSFHARSNLTEGKGIIVKGERSKPQELDYVSILNRALPLDIRVLDWAPVNPEFSSRFSTKSRVYKYFFFKKDLDMDLVKKGSLRFVGQHDFRNFCKIEGEKVKTFERIILSFELESTTSETNLNTLSPDSLIIATITGTAFLWHQIRNMMAVLFMIGRRFEDIDVIDHLLDIKKVPAKPTYDMADPLPLVLYECQYDPVDVTWVGTGITQSIIEDFKEQWREKMLQVAVIDCMMKGLIGIGINKSKDYQLREKKHVKLLKRPKEKSLDERKQKLILKKEKNQLSDKDE